MNKKNSTTLIIMLIIFFCALLSLNSATVTQNSNIVFANSTIYGRIKINNAYLYKTGSLNESLENKFCLLPETFFVKILSDYNENFYKAEFNTLTGYVKKSSLSLVNEVPQNPYPQTTFFNIKSNIGTHLRQSPKTDGSLNNIITTIERGTKNLPYLGKIWGSEGVDTQGTVWYLTTVNGHLGYIHSYYSSTFIVEQSNNEVTTLRLALTDKNLNPITNVQNAVLVGLAILPLLAVFALTYKPSKKQVSVRVKQNNSTRKTQEDYFNETEL